MGSIAWNNQGGGGMNTRWLTVDNDTINKCHSVVRSRGLLACDFLPALLLLNFQVPCPLSSCLAGTVMSLST